jgi:hypothetical protein
MKLQKYFNHFYWDVVIYPVFGKILARKNTGFAGQNPVFTKNQADF